MFLVTSGKLLTLTAHKTLPVNIYLEEDPSPMKLWKVSLCNLALLWYFCFLRFWLYDVIVDFIILKICFQICRPFDQLSDLCAQTKYGIHSNNFSAWHRLPSRFAYTYGYKPSFLIICIQCDNHGQKIKRINRCYMLQAAIDACKRVCTGH